MSSSYFESNQPHIKQPKTAAGNRTIPLLDKLAEKLPKGKKNNYLFGKDKKTLFKDTQFKKLWQIIANFAKFQLNLISCAMPMQPFYLKPGLIKRMRKNF